MEEKTYVPLKLGAQRKVWWPVSIRSGENGETRIRVLYSLRTMKEMEQTRTKVNDEAARQVKAIRDLMQNPHKDDDSVQVLTKVRVLASIRQEISDQTLLDHIHDWDDVEDETGTAVEFSTKVLKGLLEWQDVKLALATGLMQAEGGAYPKN